MHTGMPDSLRATKWLTPRFLLMKRSFMTNTATEAGVVVVVVVVVVKAKGVQLKTCHSSF